MYKPFFGLARSPFSLTPDPELLYVTPQHQEALAGLSFAVLGCKGFVVLTGDAGTGKTTLVMRTMRQLPLARTQCSLIVNPTFTAGEFLEAAMLDFGFTDIPASKAVRLSLLQEFLSKGRDEGKTSALIVDEAHKLSLEVLEEIRLLGNFEFPEEKLLQVILVGQNELDDLLERNHLRQLKQRIALRMHIRAFSAQEVGNYMRHRWAIAGGSTFPFSDGVVAGIAAASHGIPRLINIISDNALIEAFVDASADVTYDHFAMACRELRLPLPALEKNAPAPPVPVPASAAAPPEEAVEFEPMLFRSLERYSVIASKPSFLRRLRRRFGTTERVETA